MRIKVSILAAVSSLTLIGLSSPAFANCGYGNTNCNIGVKVMPSMPANFGPMTINTVQPVGYMRSVDFQRAPNVSITRIHGLGPTASISDAPSGFTNGCHPGSTQYCRADAGTPVAVQLSAPVAAAPAYQAPVVSQPRTYVGQGYDASKFAPRQYGDNTFVPGIAHIPTSIVDRSPDNADAVLNSGRTIAQPIANGGYAPRPAYNVGSYSAPVAVQAPAYRAPAISAPIVSAPYGGQATRPVTNGNGIYASNVGADGTYWEKTSGLTTFGSTVATEVICKRQLPRQTVNPVVPVPVAVPTRVVNPVVPVPYAVPTPVTVPVQQSNVVCARPAQAAGYNAAPQSRWTF